MKRTGFQKPTGAKLEAALRRQRDNREASAKRREERLRKAKRREDAFGPPGFIEWIHSLGCSVPSCGSDQIEAAHARSRGAGGDWTDVLPLCTRHHRLSHTKGVRTFERYVGFSLAAVADAVHQRWLGFAGKDEAS